jgi:glyoxylase-like metal-dependent hydrolase (beta-lactamase superfamily II)
MTERRLVEPLAVGRWRGYAIQAGWQRLDGGAMFGVVPKPLWERKATPDERNRVLLGMRCLLVEHDDGLVLVDTGAGNKENQKFHEIYGLENAAEGGRTWLEEGIAAAGHSVEDVSWVINTHFHFDHAGGNTYVDGGGTVHPTFPLATYVVQRGEHGFATHTNERTAASYFPKNWDPIDATGRLHLVEGEVDVLPGVRVLPTPGHVPHHQSVLFDDQVLYLGDLCPTAWHLPLAWIMGYDVEPLVTLETKRRVLGRAEAEGWRLVFEHDASETGGRLTRDGKGFRLAP